MRLIDDMPADADHHAIATVASLASEVQSSCNALTSLRNAIEAMLPE